MVHLSLLLSHWLSMVHDHLLLAHWLHLWHTSIYTDSLLSSIDQLALSMLLYHLLFANWLSLWYTTIFSWPSGPFLCITTIFYWPTGYLYGTLQSSTVPLVISMVHYHLLLAHSWLQYRQRNFYILHAYERGISQVT